MLQAVLVTLSGYNSPHIEFNDGKLPQNLPQAPIGDLATFNEFQKQRQRLSYRVKFTEEACNILGITPSEQDMLQQILILAVYTKQLESFIQIYGTHNNCTLYQSSSNLRNLNNESKNRGIYIVSLCDGIGQLLESYRSDIIFFRRKYGVSPISEQCVSICRLQKTFRKVLLHSLIFSCFFLFKIMFSFFFCYARSSFSFFFGVYLYT